jgi:peroxiredoxin
MSSWRVVVGVGMLACSPTAPVALRPSAHPATVVAATPATADQIVAAMVSTYRNAQAYSDHGESVADFGRFKERRTFTTAFVRPDRFRFAFFDGGDPDRGYVIWSDSDGVFSQWYLHPGVVDGARDLSYAVAVATGVSGGTSHTVPALLIPEVGGNSLAVMKGWKLDGTEAIAGHDCWRLARPDGHEGDILKIWIDRDSHLLRRLASHEHIEAARGVQAFEVDETTSYDPVLHATPDQLARPDLHGVTPNKYVEPRWAGLTMHFPSAQIVQIVPGGPAERAGLRVGDLIVEVQGGLIADDGDFQRALDHAAFGAKVDVVAAREGTEVRVVLEPAHEPDLVTLAQRLVGTDAPDVDLGSIKLSKLKGHVVILAFWSSWCRPCEAEVPRLDELQSKHPALRIFGVSGDAADVIADYAAKHKATYPLVHDDLYAITADYLVGGLPTLVVIDKTGVIRHVEVGATDLAALEPVLMSLLAAP